MSKKRLTFQVVLEGENATRIERLLRKVETDDWKKLFGVMSQHFETIVNMQEDIHPRGGTLYLVAKFPDGTTDEKQVFKDDEGRPARLN